MKRYLVSILSLLLAPPLLAQEPAVRETPATPLLERLDQEMRGLYESVQQSVVRVQLPPPRWVAEMLAEDHPAARWTDLDPQVKSRLDAQQRNVAAGRYDEVGAVLIPPSTRPAEAPATQPAPEAWRISGQPDQPVTIESRIERGDSRVLIVTQPGEAGRSGLRVEARAGSTFLPNNVAIVLDDQGHLLVPIFLEREQITRPINVSLAPGQVIGATFIGSDRQTNLTVLKADQPVGRPARFASAARPAAGGLVMILSPNNDTARLAVWTDSASEWGVVVQVDGAVLGFARHGQFLSAGLAQPVVKQLIDKGHVQRPTLGVVVTEVRPDDPLRSRLPALGKRPALLVRRVLPESAAARAGLRNDDLILTLDGRPVGNIPSFAAAVAQCGPEAKLGLLRDGEEQTVMVRFEPAANDNASGE